VHETRKTLGKDIELLGSILGRVDKHKDALGIAIQEGSLALGNLAVAFESTTGTYGSRVQVQPGIQFRPDQFLCQTLVNDGAPQSVCDLIEKLLTPLLPATSAAAAASANDQKTDPTSPQNLVPNNLKDKLPSLFSLLGGDRK
jgi:phospholipid/cholesterol/gamma-HCH transport system substrate-binding protein